MISRLMRILCPSAWHWTDGADRWMPDKCCVAIFKAATTTVSVGRNRHDNSDQDERK